MNKLILEAMPQQNRLVLYEGPRIASGNKGAVQVRFSYALDPERWAAPTKSAVFYRDEDTVFHVLLENDIATVPHEVLADAGYFYLGLIGMQGDDIITTEAIRLNVVQGAITTATEVTDPTPDIYQQILNKYVEMDAKVYELTRMRGAATESVYPLDGEYITEGSITTNGISAAVSFKIDGFTLAAYGSHTTDGNILPEIAPLFNALGSIPLHCAHADLDVSIEKGPTEGDWARIKIINKSSQTVGIYGVQCFGVYDLAAPFIGELADVRHLNADKTFPRAGDAIRAHFQNAANAITKMPMGVSPIRVDDYSPFTYELQVVTNKTDAPVMKYGKNLLKSRHLSLTEPSVSNGITITRGEKGELILNGTAEISFGWVLTDVTWLDLRGGCKYIVKGGSTSKGAVLRLDYKDADGKAQIHYGDASAPLEWLPGYELSSSVLLMITKGATFNNYEIEPMIELGENSTYYEPYEEPVSYYAQETDDKTGTGSLFIPVSGEVVTVQSADPEAMILVLYRRDTATAFSELEQRVKALEAALLAKQ